MMYPLNSPYILAHLPKKNHRAVSSGFIKEISRETEVSTATSRRWGVLFYGRYPKGLMVGGFSPPTIVVNILFIMVNDDG